MQTPCLSSRTPGNDADAPEPASLLPHAPVVGRLNTTGSWACAAAIVEASLLRGDRDLAATQYEALCQMRDAGNRMLWFFGLVEGLCAMSAAAGGRWDAAEEHFASALE